MRKWKKENQARTEEYEKKIELERLIKAMDIYEISYPTQEALVLGGEYVKQRMRELDNLSR